MAKVGLAEAAKLTGKSQSTIHRAMTSHKISFEKNEAGERVVDVSELARWWPVKVVDATTRNHETGNRQHIAQADMTAAQLEAATTRIEDLRQQIEALQADKDDLRRERDRLLGVIESTTEQVRLLTDQRDKTQTMPPARRSSGWWFLPW